MKAPGNTKTAKKEAKKQNKKAVNKSLADALKVKKAENKQANSEKKPKKVFVKGPKPKGSESGGDKDKKKSGGKPAFKKGGDFKGKGKGKSDAGAKTPVWDRKASKPNYAMVEKLKLNWNKARLKSISDAERAAVVNDMAKQVDQHILAVTLRHDASRAVQSIIQFGTLAQRTKVLTDIKEKLHEIAKTPYGHFVVLKAITYCTTPAEQKQILTGLGGHFVAIGTNVIGARTVESLINIYSAKACRALRAEFYGRKFVALCSEPPKNLRALLESQPTKKSAILDHMRDLVQKFVDKGLLEFSYAHQLIWEYAEEIELDQAGADSAAVPPRMLDLMELLVDSVAKLLTTKPGAKLVCRMATYGTAKDRKRMLKPLKGHVMESLCHESAHLGIMRLLDVTDDTVTVQKSILEELRGTAPIVKYSASGNVIGTPLPPLATIACNKYGRKFLLRLLTPDTRHLEPDEEVLFPDKAYTSKKSPEARRREHLYYIRSALTIVLSNHAEFLSRDKFGYQVLFAAVRAFCPPQLVSALCLVFTGQDVSPTELPASAAGGEDDSDASEEEEEEEEEGGMEPGEEDEAAEAGAADGSDDDSSEGEREDEPAAMDVEQGSIQEDPSAHHLMKLLCQMQVSYEQIHPPALAESKAKKTKKKAAPEPAPEGRTVNIDEAFWEASADNAPALNFGSQLLGNLVERNLLPEWLSCNRPCFALAELAKVPSARQPLKDALSDHAAAVKAAEKDHSGGKLLASLI